MILSFDISTILDTLGAQDTGHNFGWNFTMQGTFKLPIKWIFLSRLNGSFFNLIQQTFDLSA